MLSSVRYNKPFFSIIIPSYNRGHSIHIPIESILSQTYENWELIIIDDGSTDNTKEILDTYQDVRIKYFYQEHQERSAARNLGICKATGEWICFQDSDDEYLPGHLDVLYKNILLYPDYKVFRTGMYIYQQGKLIRKSIFNDTNKYSLYPFDAFTTFAINHEIIRNYSFDNSFFNSEDMHLLIRIAGKYPIQVIPIYTNIYHYNPNNSGGLDSDYNTIHQNKIKVFNSLLHSDNILKTHYLKRKLCLSHILILSGDFKYNIKNIMISAFNNFVCFFSHPIEFIKLLCRIVYVKIMEKINLKSFDDRF